MAVALKAHSSVDVFKQHNRNKFFWYPNTTMNSPTCLFVLLLFVSPSTCTCAYSDEEFGVLKAMGASLGVKSFTFVQDQNCVNILKDFRKFLEGGSYSTVISSRMLGDILSDSIKKMIFFERRVIVATKENLNFTDVLEKSLTDIRDSYIPMSVNFFVVRGTINGYNINKAFNIRPDYNVSLEYSGTLPKGKAADARFIRTWKVDFQGATLKMLHILDEIECTQGSVKDLLKRIECFHQEIIKMSSIRLNFRIKNVPCRERQYPYNYPNGSLSELFQALTRGEADLSSGSYLIMESRLQLYDFVWPVFTTKSMMYIRFRSKEINWLAYVRPISGRVWRVIATLIIITGALLSFFDRSRTGNFKIRISFILELVKSILASLQVFSNQAVQNISDWYSDRTVFMVTYLLVVSLYQAYTGCLISSLTVATPDYPFSSLHDFFLDGTYKIMTVRKGFHSYFVRSAIEGMHMKTDKLMLMDHLLPHDIHNAIFLLCQSKALVYVEFRENIVQYQIPCQVMQLPESLLFRNIGFGFPKNSPYKEIIKQGLTVFRFTGVLHRMKKQLLTYTKLEEKQVTEDEFVHVTMGHVFSLFLILSGGIAASVIIFFLEILSFYYVEINVMLKSLRIFIKLRADHLQRKLRSN